MTYTNKNLIQAKSIKNDEFYTAYSTIEDELKFYIPFFKDKIVYCNCDNSNSNFVKYFKQNKDKLGIKKLIYSGYINGSGTSFDSPESLELLKQADVVVTNPPFSLFKDFCNLLISYHKKFIVLGSLMACTYTGIVDGIVNNEIWFGETSRFNKPKFTLPEGCIQNNGDMHITPIHTRWYTNIKSTSTEVRYQPITKRYIPEKYPKYDNYDAIEVSRSCDIPANYKGLMGVPISFLDKYNPNQFKLIGSSNQLSSSDFWLNGKQLFRRFVIQFR